MTVIPFSSIAQFTAGTAETASAQVSDVLAEILERARTHNADTHIYTRTLDARALRAIESSKASRTAPLRGVPVAIKDNIDVEGQDTSCGRRLAPRAAVDSAAIVKHLESLGAIIFAKTNLDEAALGASGRNPRFGRCHNPRSADRLSGGSSSGSAAAVAAGHALLGIGTDTLGSVRIPAAFCGVVGFKPTHGRLPMAGIAPLYPRFDSVGLLAASVADIAFAAAALLTDAAPRRTRRSGDLEVAGFELSVLDDAALAAAAGDVAQGYRRCVRWLRSFPRPRLRAAPLLDWNATAHAALWQVAHEFAQRSAARLPGYHALDDIDGDLGRLLERAAMLPAGRLASGIALLERATLALTHGLSQADALLTPTCPESAPRLDQNPARHVAAFVAPANVAGLPAVAWTQRLGSGEALSLQLIGRFGEDLRLIDMARAVQRLLDRAAAHDCDAALEAPSG